MEVNDARTVGSIQHRETVELVTRCFRAKRLASNSRALDAFRRTGSKDSSGRVSVLPIRKAES